MAAGIKNTDCYAFMRNNNTLQVNQNTLFTSERQSTTASFTGDDETDEEKSYSKQRSGTSPGYPGR